MLYIHRQSDAELCCLLNVAHAAAVTVAEWRSVNTSVCVQLVYVTVLLLNANILNYVVITDFSDAVTEKLLLWHYTVVSNLMLRCLYG